RRSSRTSIAISRVDRRRLGPCLCRARLVRVLLMEPSGPFAPCCCGWCVRWCILITLQPQRAQRSGRLLWWWPAFSFAKITKGRPDSLVWPPDPNALYPARRRLRGSCTVGATQRKLSSLECTPFPRVRIYWSSEDNFFEPNAKANSSSPDTLHLCVR